MIRGLVGYASSLAALGAAPGLGAALARTGPGIPAYLERKGEDFATIVDRKRRQRVEVVSGGEVGARRLGSTDRESDGRAGCRSSSPGLLDDGARLHPGGDQSIRP